MSDPSSTLLLWFYEPNKTLVHRFATLTKAETWLCSISGLDFLHHCFKTCLWFIQKWRYSMLELTLCFFHRTLLIWRTSVRFPYVQEFFQVAGKVDWTLKVGHRWPPTSSRAHKSVLKKLDDDFRLTVSLAVQLFALSYKDNDLCRISTVSETGTVQKATAEMFALNCCSSIFFFQKVIVWQWPNCGQYLH